MHFHVHVIPRYQSDVLDPRGGIRWVLPDKAAYAEAPTRRAQNARFSLFPRWFSRAAQL